MTAGPGESGFPDLSGGLAAQGPGVLPAPRLRRRDIVRIALVTWLLTRAFYLAVTYYAVAFSAGTSGSAAGLLRAWGQWDTNWYELISRVGYRDPAMAAFFPLYPALVGGLAALLGDGSGPIWPGPDDLRLGLALAVANLGTLLAFIGLGLLAHHEDPRSGRAGVQRVLLITASFPLAFFTFAGYTEGPFLAEVVFALYFARRGRWAAAAGAALLAGLTRPTGLALVLALVFEYGRQAGWWSKAIGSSRPPAAGRLVSAAMVVSAVPLAVGAFALYLGTRFGSPLIWLQAESTVWHRHPAAPWYTAARLVHRILGVSLFSPGEAALLLQLVPVAICLAVSLAAVRRAPFAFTLYTLAIVALAVAAPIPTQYELIVSAGRFVFVAFPVYLIVAGWSGSRPWLAQAWVVTGLGIQAVLVGVFLRGGWVA